MHAPRLDERERLPLTGEQRCLLSCALGKDFRRFLLGYGVAHAV